ncbi:DUF3080 domain-containing protein [Vibrio chagasii]|nr:DUF3080 domain-containing protein [Vibrio chagasii]
MLNVPLSFYWAHRQLSASANVGYSTWIAERNSVLGKVADEFAITIIKLLYSKA